METLIGRALSHYRIVERLGAGGMGVVYLARDERLDRDVALKFLPEELAQDPDWLARFVQEAKLLASVNHPHISTIYGFEETEDGSRYIVLERLEGETLAERMKRGPLSLPEALRVCGQIAEALEAAHERGVIHRDLSPRNIMLTPRGGAKVLDFGLARQDAPSPGDKPASIGTTSHKIEASEVVGSPGYMSPEHLRGQAQDNRTDIFAFGCVLYECLTGRRAFASRTPMDTMVAVLHTDPDWSALPTDTPAKIRDLLARCLEKDPQQRLRDIGDARLEIDEARGTRRAAAASLAVSATPHNLPHQATSFVGRECELSECAELLDTTELVTLTGVGGCGKTRLALRLAESRLEKHTDGIWFVDLAPVSDPERVPVAVATVLDVREEPGVPLLEALTRHLSGKQALLLLDNCEHVLVPCVALVERLLASAPSLRLLATSREVLGVKGERPYAVRSLSIPTVEAKLNLDAVGAFEAVRLFVERARVVAPDFRLTETTAPAVAEICRRLDGIPLAIELAAARVKALSVEQIRAKLDDRFRLLTGGSKSALPRHQTLRATLQWSYEHLAPEERRLFRLLSVFSGGWTLEGATTVAGEGADEFEVLDLLTRLIDKSLVVVERESSGEPRYRMLETVRQYAQERLSESEEGDRSRSRHLDFYLSLAEQAESELRGSHQASWLLRLGREHENILSALEWCDRAIGGADKGLGLAGSMQNYWLTCGLSDVGLRMTRQALRREGAQAPTRARALALLGAGQLSYRKGAYREASAYSEESLTISRGLEGQYDVRRALCVLGNAVVALGDPDAALRCYGEALAIAREVGDKLGLSTALNGLAEILRLQGELAKAAPLYEECLLLSREIGNIDNVANDLLNLAMIATEQREFSAARERIAESLRLAEEIGAMDHVVLGLDIAAGVAVVLCESEWAARLHGVVEAWHQRTGDRRDPSDEKFIVPLIARARSELGEAAFAAAYTEGGTVSLEDALAEVRAWLEKDVPAASGAL